MDLSRISKAVAGAVMAGAGGAGTAAIVVPDAVVMPWWGYLAVGGLNALLGFVGVYLAPRNAP